jgi:hypothetical protein
MLKERTGFGYTVLTRVVPDVLSGTASFTLNEAGLMWQIEAPLQEIMPLSQASSVPGTASAEELNAQFLSL